MSLHIPKTAGNSVQYALKKYTEDAIKYADFDGVKFHKMGITNSKITGLTKHSLLYEYEKFFDLNNFFKFTCIRNPWDRILSWYFFDNKNIYYIFYFTGDKKMYQK